MPKINTMETPKVVSLQEWEAARQQLLLKEKALTRSRDALAAERRRMPWMASESELKNGDQFAAFEQLPIPPPAQRPRRGSFKFLMEWVRRHDQY